MEELTIEQKAKRYDEILARAKGANIPYYKEDIMSKVKEFVDYLLPELVESEDERIRTALLNHLKKMWGNANNDVYGVHVEDVIAWLEKQGEKEKFIEKELGYIRGYREEAIKRLHELEKQDEQEPADKVEPKSDIERGKWYVCNTPRYTDFVVGKAYYCNKNGMLKPNENEMARYVARNCFHLWTIQDAKDGDVLAEDSCIFIIKKLNHDNSDIAEIYCCLFDDGDFEVIGSLMFDATSTYPATKEQRDLLFQKVREAGYEWDANKKELKKIGQKPAEEYNITGIGSKNAQGKLGEMIKKLKPANEVLEQKLANTVKDVWKDMRLEVWAQASGNREANVNCDNTTMFSLCDIDEIIEKINDCQIKQEPAGWSEEDEVMYQGVIETEQYMLDVVYGRKIFAVGNESIKEECTKELAWLKSIKDRIK